MLTLTLIRRQGHKPSGWALDIPGRRLGLRHVWAKLVRAKLGRQSGSGWAKAVPQTALLGEEHVNTTQENMVRAEMAPIPMFGTMLKVAFAWQQYSSVGIILKNVTSIPAVATALTDGASSRWMPGIKSGQTVPPPAA